MLDALAEEGVAQGLGLLLSLNLGTGVPAFACSVLFDMRLIAGWLFSKLF